MLSVCLSPSPLIQVNQSTSPWVGGSGLGTAVWYRSSSLSPAYTEGSCWLFEKKCPSHSCESTGTSLWSALDTSFPSDGSTLRSVGDMEEGGKEGEKEKWYITIRTVVRTPLRGHKINLKVCMRKKQHSIISGDYCCINCIAKSQNKVLWTTNLIHKTIKEDSVLPLTLWWCIVCLLFQCQWNLAPVL